MMMIARRQIGVTLLEAVITLAIMAVGLMGLMRIGDSLREDTRNAQFAESVKQFGVATRNYTRDNYATIAAAATSSNGYLITASMLATGGYLPTGTTSKVAGYNQDVCAVVMAPSPGKLNALVVTEQGDTIDDVTLSNIVGLGGASLGSVLSSANTAVTGAKGGWSVPIVDFDNKTNQLNRRCDGASAGTVRVTTGHVAMALWYEGNGAETNTLYRDAVPGQPQLNRMNTPIVFNAPQTLDAVCATAGALANDAAGKMLNCTGGKWAYVSSLYWGEPVANAASLPACVPTLAGVTRIVRVPTVGTGPRPFTCDGAAWNALSIDDNGNLTLPGVLTAGKVTLLDVVVSGNACTTTGQVARDAAGGILTCQAGKWSGGAGNQGKMDVITASGSYTIPSDAVKVTVVGAGGGGGSCLTWDVGGAGGGAGGAAIKYYRGMKGTVITVTIGAGGGSGTNGGPTYFGAALYATGGEGGYTQYGYPGGEGGQGYGGDINLGGGGGQGFSYAPTSRRFSGGMGGNSIFGGGAAGSGNDYNYVKYGRAYGAGGGGASSVCYGGNGSQGVVIVEY